MATVDRPNFPSEGKAPDPDIAIKRKHSKTRKKREKAGLNHTEKKASKRSSKHISEGKLTKVKHVNSTGKSGATEAFKHQVSTGSLWEVNMYACNTIKSEQFARIEAAVAMSELASGGFSQNSYISSPGRNSDHDSDNDSVLVIDCPDEEATPPTLKLRHNLSGHVQEDVVSSSCIHKQSVHSQKSSNILSILENRGRPMVNNLQNVSVGQTVVAPQMIFVASNVNKGMFIDQGKTVIKQNIQAPNLCASETDSLLPTVVKANNNLAKAPGQGVSVMHDYCPPTKRSRTVETQTSCQTTETKIPDFNKLTLNSSESHIPKQSSNDTNIKKTSKTRTQLPSSAPALGKKNLSSHTKKHDGLRAGDLRKQPNGLGQAMSSESYVSQWLDSCSNHSTQMDQEINENKFELGSVLSTVSYPPAISMESDEGLQIALQNALKRLKEDLARASPKERAFMLGQIQAIVTMQKRQSIGIMAMNSLINRQINHFSPSQNIATVEKSQTVSTPGRRTSQSNGQTGQEISKVVDIKTGQSFPVELHRFGGQNSGSQQKTNNSLKESPIPSCLTQFNPESYMKIPIMTVTSSRSLTPSKFPGHSLSTFPVTNIPVVTNNALLPTSAMNRSKSLSPNPVKASDSGSHLPFKKRRMLVNSAGDIASRGDSQYSPVISSTASVQSLVPIINSQVTTPSINAGGRTGFFNKIPDLNDVEIALKKDEDGDIPLHIAVAQENIMAVNKYISLMKLVNSPVDAFNKDRQTPLHLAVVINQVPIVEILLQAQSNVNLPNSIGQSALHLAAKGGYWECMNLLLLKSQHQVQLDKKDFEGYSPLHLSVQRGDINVTRLLIEHNADTNVQDGKSGRTPLFHAAEKNLFGIVDILLAAEAKVNVMNYAGITAVMAASGRGYKEVVTLLMQFGADTKGTNIGDLTSKGPPVRNTTSLALRQTMYSPNPGSDEGSMSSREKARKHSIKS